MQYSAICCCLLFFYLIPHAQYQVQHFTTDNGLPSNGIKGMEWDEGTGFLWVATEAGLVRYNGMAFKTFDAGTNPELGSNRIVMMQKNAAGKILVAGQEGNLSVIKANTVSHYFTGGKKAKYNYNYYGAITASQTLADQCFKKPWDVRHTFTNTVVVSLSDTACLLLTTGNLFYYSVSTEDPVMITDAPTDIKNLFAIDGQVYYLDAKNRLFLFNVYKNGSAEEPLQDEAGRPFVIADMNSRLFWQSGTSSPVLLQDAKAWVIEKIRKGALQCRLVAAGIPDNVLFKYVQYKKNGNYLFLGSDSKGFYIIHPNQLTIKQPEGLDINQKNSFYGQVELPDGNIITNDGQVIGGGQPKNNFGFGNFMKTNVLLSDSLLVYGKADSLIMYNKNTTQRRLLFLSHVNEAFAFTRSGNRYYFASQQGIAVVKENGTIDFVKLFDEKTDVLLQTFVMIETSPGKLALATCEGLLGFDTKTGRLDTLLKIPSVCIRALYQEGGYTFIGTYGGGFYVMKNGKIKAMPLDINKNLKYSHCFIKDNNGFCWISTNNGLFKVKMQDLTDAYDKDLQQVYYHFLGKEDGMQTTEMNGGCTPCALRLKNGQFSFPTMDGMLWFNPEKTDITLPTGEIYIDKIIADDKEMFGNKLVPPAFSEYTKKIDIALAIAAWCKKENLYVDYRVNDDNWMPVSMVANQPVISLNNIGYGKYRIEIRKLNGFGINNYSYTSISISVATPFYHQWWFRILAMLAIGGLGYLVFRLRLRQYAIREEKLSALVEEKTRDLHEKNIELEKNDQIKTRLISVINHDIITPLKFMHYAGKALAENKGMINREQELETIADITQTAKDMEMLSSQILNWIIYQNPNKRMQKEEFDLRQLVEVIFGVLQFPAKVRNTNLQNQVPVHFVVYQYLEPMRILIYNLVVNAVNFTRDGVVNVTVALDGNKVIIKVTDNGLGMTQQQISNLMSEERIIASANVDNKKGTGLGYMIIKDLLKLTGGTLAVSSSKQEGTTISVSLPAVAMH